MPDWLIERGIGETRAVLIEGDEILEARVLPDDTVPAGSVLEARLKRVGRPAVAQAHGIEYLMPKGAPGVTEGAPLTIEVTREAIPGAEPWKRPLARITDDPSRLVPPQGEGLPFPAPHDRLEAAGWSELLSEAREGIMRFAGGELRVTPTPAMTLIDVDGQLPALELALTGAAAAARTIRRHGVGGSIGIDLPTVGGKAQRQAIADAFDARLPQPFERTSVNGFGFLQVVRARRHPSLFELAADRPSFEARALLRRASCERGVRRMVAHPAVAAVLQERLGWLDALSRQIGGAVSLRSEPSLTMSAGYAEPA